MIPPAASFTNKEVLDVLALSKYATAIYRTEHLIIEFANDTMLSFWAKDRSVVGKPLQDAVPELAQQSFTSLLGKVWRTGMTFEATDIPFIALVNEQPQKFYYDIEYRAINDENGKISCILHTAINVTEKHYSRDTIDAGKQREQHLSFELSRANQNIAASNEEVTASKEELLKSRQHLVDLNNELEGRVTSRTSELLKAQAESENQRGRLARFFMQAPAGICILDGPDLRFELINPLYQQLFPGRELFGKPLLEALPEIKGEPIWGILQNVYRTGETFEGNELLIPLIRQQGCPVEDRYFNFIYQARLDINSQVDGILVFVIEVTDMVLTRRRVQDSEKQLRTYLNAIPQIAWTNNDKGEVDFFNQRWYDYTGLDYEETKTWGWKKVLHPDDLQATMNAFLSIIDSGINGEFENREKRFDGAYRWHLVRVLPINDEQGKIKQWIGTATDIHDLKMLQEHKDDFISIASHELKTPVTSLKSSLQLLDRMKERPNGMLPKLVEQANRSINKITDLIEDLLDASLLNERQLHLIKKVFTASQMLEGCCNHLRAAGNHQLVFEGNRGLQVFADEDRIYQVVVNFVNNAIKYAPESKRIYLIVEKLPGFAKISVKDNGPGIAPDKIPFLFSKYYRAEYTGAQYSGLGLGLYISAEIIKRHGGEIGVDSELGKGSTFWFTLPL